MKGRLVKWDADKLGDEDPQKLHHLADPSQHPACIEVIDLVEDEKPKVIYRRDDHATDDPGRTVSGESGDGTG
jgi:hypothetical protein